MKIEEGKFYKDREGTVYEVLAIRDGSVIAYEDGDVDTRYVDGRSTLGGESVYDLIEEVPAPLKLEGFVNVYEAEGLGYKRFRLVDPIEVDCELPKNVLDGYKYLATIDLSTLNEGNLVK
jgi:hypothetical protein